MRYFAFALLLLVSCRVVADPLCEPAFPETYSMCCQSSKLADRKYCPLWKSKEFTRQMRCIFRDGGINREGSGWIVRTSDEPYKVVGFLQGPPIASQGGYVNIKGCNSAAVAHVHSHPRPLSAKPTKEDIASAIKCDTPFYVVSDSAIWRVLPKHSEDEKVTPVVEQVKGDWIEGDVDCDGQGRPIPNPLPRKQPAPEATNSDPTSLGR